MVNSDRKFNHRMFVWFIVLAVLFVLILLNGCKGGTLGIEFGLETEDGLAATVGINATGPGVEDGQP